MNITRTPSPAARQAEGPARRPDPLRRHALQDPLQRRADVMQRATWVNYGNLTDFRFGTASGYVGTSMSSHLDPADPKVGSDTNSSTAFPVLFKALQSGTSSTWVRGHLLNHDLGGIAHFNNLFPITTAANGEHKYEVEYPVKHWLNEGCEIDYAVQAFKDNPSDTTSGDGTFACVARVTKGPKNLQGKTLNKSIHSKSSKVSWTRALSGGKSKAVNSFAMVTHGSGNNVYRDDQKAPKARPGWEHRSGESGDNHYLMENSKVALSLEDTITLSKASEEERYILMDFFQDYKVVGSKRLDPDEIKDIVEEVQSEATSMEEQILLTKEALEDAGYQIVKIS